METEYTDCKEIFQNVPLLIAHFLGIRTKKAD